MLFLAALLWLAEQFHHRPKLCKNSKTFLTFLIFDKDHNLCYHKAIYIKKNNLLYLQNIVLYLSNKSNLWKYA